MTISKEEKRQNAIEIYRQIYECKTEEDCERISDILDESMLADRIYKKAYKFLSDELDDQLSWIVEEEIRSSKSRGYSL